MIPITFNHDDELNLKKGNIRGQDFASLLSFAMSKEAGILDVFGNDCSITAVAQNTPTGYATLTFSKGYISVFGRIVYIEENEQVQVALPSESSSVTGILGIRINLGETGANEVTWFTKTTALQMDNLLQNQVNGIYEFALYNYTATNNSFTLGNKIASTIESLPDYLKGANFETPLTADNSKKLGTTEFVNNFFNNKINSSYYEDTSSTTKWWNTYDIGGLRIVYGKIYIRSNSNGSINFGQNYFKDIAKTSIQITANQIDGSYIERSPYATTVTSNYINIKNPSATNVFAHFLIIGEKP